MELELYERSFCDCRKCACVCKAMPGSLAPGDFEKIAKYSGTIPSEKFLEDNFRASDGPLVRMFHDDGTPEDLHIPTLVPAQNEKGQCVFLDEDDHCLIHRVAPFGCRIFNVCDPPSMEDDEKSTAMLESILKSPDYLAMWEHLVGEALIVAPLVERRKAMKKLLAEREGGDFRVDQF